MDKDAEDRINRSDYFQFLQSAQPSLGNFPTATKKVMTYSDQQKLVQTQDFHMDNPVPSYFIWVSYSVPFLVGAGFILKYPTLNDAVCQWLQNCWHKLSFSMS